MFKFSKHGLNLSLDLIVVQFYLNDTKIWHFTQCICNMFLTDSYTYSLRQRDFHLHRFNTVTYGKRSIQYIKAQDSEAGYQIKEIGRQSQAVQDPVT